MYRREVQRLNTENFVSWKDSMKPHISRIGYNVTHWLEHEYTTPIGPLNVKKMNEKRNQNSLMIEIASTLNDVESDDIKIYTIAK